MKIQMIYKSGKQVELNSPGDVYCEIDTSFHDEDFAFEIQLWAEEAKVGEKLEDEQFTMEVLEQWQK